MSDAQDPVMFLRQHVESMLVEAGLRVVDIVTHDMDPEDGETEWIVGPVFHRLWLSNNYGKLLMGDMREKAEVPIRHEIERLKVHMRSQGVDWR